MLIIDDLCDDLLTKILLNMKYSYYYILLFVSKSWNKICILNKQYFNSKEFAIVLGDHYNYITHTDENITESIRVLAIHTICKNKINLIDFLISHSFNFDNITMCFAALKGYINIFEYLLGKYKLSSDIHINATRSGNLNLIKYLEELKCPEYNKECITDICASFRYIHILEHLKENNKLEIDCEALFFCIFDIEHTENRNNCIIWLIENGFKRNKYLCVQAIYNGDLDLLKFLVEDMSCEIANELCFYQSIKTGKKSILKWLIQKCGYDPIYHMCQVCDEFNRPNLLEWLIKHNMCSCGNDHIDCAHSELFIY